jgi:hypothetical protein
VSKNAGLGSEAEVVVCRCERVTVGDLEDARRRFHVASLRELKLVTRAAMGICQGRVCGPVLDALQRQWFPTDPEPLRNRMPLRPVLFGRLIEEADHGRE